MFDPTKIKQGAVITSRLPSVMQMYWIVKEIKGKTVFTINFSDWGNKPSIEKVPLKDLESLSKTLDSKIIPQSSIVIFDTIFQD